MRRGNITEPFKVLSLFAGIGGFDLGLERTGGFKTVAFCEIDPKAQLVLAKHWPDVPCYDDVRSLTAELLASDGIHVNAIVGGFPCQDLSSAGARAGLGGDRSGLWFEMARLIGELRPRWVIVENVAELLANGFDTVLRTLASLRYDAEWQCIPACAVGAPHERDRVWIIANPSEEPGLYESNGWEATQRLLDYPTAWQARPWRASDPAVCRVDDGFPDRVDRTEQLGNSVLPVIPELIGRAILAAEGRASNSNSVSGAAYPRPLDLGTGDPTPPVTGPHFQSECSRGDSHSAQRATLRSPTCAMRERGASEAGPVPHYAAKVGKLDPTHIEGL